MCTKLLYVAASLKKQLTDLSYRGDHRVMEGDLGFTGMPGLLCAPDGVLGAPAIVFGHHWGVSAHAYRETLIHLASWGFVVVAPDTQTGTAASIPSFVNDLHTALDIATGVRLGEGNVSVDPSKLGAVGHGMGGSSAILATESRLDIRATAAVFPVDSTPSAVSRAAYLDTPGLLLEATDSSSDSSQDLADAWHGERVHRRIPGAHINNFAANTKTAKALGLPGADRDVAKLVRTVLTGYLLSTVKDDTDYDDFVEMGTSLPGTVPVTTELLEEEAKPKGWRKVLQQVSGA